MRSLLISAAFALLVAPAALAQERYSCAIERPFAGGTLQAQVAVFEDEVPQARVVAWIGDRGTAIAIYGSWAADPGGTPNEGMLMASFRPDPKYRDLSPGYQLRAPGGAILRNAGPAEYEADGTIRFYMPWDRFRTQTDAAGGIEMVVVLANGRVIARRRFDTQMLDTIVAGVAPAIKKLEPLLADPARRCTDLGELDRSP